MGKVHAEIYEEGQVRVDVLAPRGKSMELLILVHEETHVQYVITREKGRGERSIRK